MQLTDEEWKQRLSPEQYEVMRKSGTEAPFSGDYVMPNTDGAFNCVACGNLLFKSDSQYESRAPGLIGWPSFADIAQSDAVEFVEDTRHGMQRTEVICKKCGGHLGHVFDGDPDSSTGKHYCINSVCLKFNPDAKNK